MAEFTGREELILQKCIRAEIKAAYGLPYIDEAYINDLNDIYDKLGPDQWEGFDTL